MESKVVAKKIETALKQPNATGQAKVAPVVPVVIDQRPKPTPVV